MKFFRLLTTIALLFTVLTSSYSQPFLKWDDSIQVKIGSSYLANPWAGGLNFIQSSNIDLNLDGIPDLFMFDRTGDKVRTFINKGTAGAVDFKYDPQYESKFPVLHNWALLADYDGDGKEDIFTYTHASGYAGFDIYKNISTPSTGLQFQLVSTLLKSDYNAITRSNLTPQPIPDGGVPATWDGITGTPWTGSTGNYTKSSISIGGSFLTAGNWDIKSILLNINHPHDNDLIVYLISPCGTTLRLIKSAGGSGSNFTNTIFNHYYGTTGVIGTTGYNTAPFTSTYVPEAGPSAWATFIAGCTNPNGTWSLTVGDQTSGASGALINWAISFYSPGPNLYVSAVDIPAVTDIDNDGDLDIVTFAITGTFAEYHKNLSKELYGTADSLKFQMANRCWGYAAQDALSTDYTLYDTCSGNVSAPELIPDTHEAKSGERHSGSCELCIDLDGDGDKELISGGIGYNNMTKLTNGGTITDASFVLDDTSFPSNDSSTSAVALTVFPCAYYTDVNDDGIKDLIVSPNAANVSENFNSVVYYKNAGTNWHPVFQYQQSNLLQDNMIEVGEGAYPVFFDYDNDGLLDLFIGNYGYFSTSAYVHEIALFKNIGTATQPKFQLITRDYNNMSTLGLSNMVPAFGDMDGDGDKDMIIGGYDGKLQYFQNTAAPGATAVFSLTPTAVNLKNSAGRTIDVGDFAAPQIVDMDNNGTNDLVIGSRNGKLAYYSHIGTSTIPVMDSITHSFGGVVVNQYGYFTGYSYPFVFKQGGVTNMFVGEEMGNIRQYNNIDGNLTGTFHLVDSTFEGIFQGTRTAPFGADLDNDGYMDLIVGNYEGGVSFYKGASTLTSINDIENPMNFTVNLYPNPANTNFTIRISNEQNKNYLVELYNIMGQLITSERIVNNTLTIDTPDLKQGVYICKISEVNNSGVKTTPAVTKRIIIQH